MDEETRSRPVAFGPWLEEILARSDAELRRRRIVLRLEVDRDFIVERDSDLEAALVELCKLMIATVPDGCEIYLGSARSSAAVARLGTGHWSARWQVAGEAGVSTIATPLRPRPGGAERHSKSPLANRVRERFAKTRWDLSLEALDQGRELLARASFR